MTTREELFDFINWCHEDVNGNYYFVQSFNDGSHYPADAEELVDKYLASLVADPPIEG